MTSWLDVLCATVGAALLVALPGLVAPGHAAEPDAAKLPQAAAPPLEAESPSAPVAIDGSVLFHVRGVSAYPAEKRAAAIAERIEALARAATFQPDTLRAVESDLGTIIQAGEKTVMLVTESDARMEGVARKVLAAAFVARIRDAIAEYRQMRSREGLIRSGSSALGATAVFALLVALVVVLGRRLQSRLEARYQARIHSVGIQSFQIVRAERIWGALVNILRTLRALAVLVVAFVYLEYVLGLFPWTRGTGNQLFGYVLDPLGVIGKGIAGQIPNLMFLAILFVVASYLLKLVHLFFRAVERNEVKLSGFEAEWAEPTYKLARFMIVAFALVVAYPYIPGSNSDAFKGVSIFIGVVFSLGSSSAVANMIAGYMMTYRRAFRIGDRVKIGAVEGDVTEMRLQVTHVRTVKNEEVIIPNSSILNNEVMNYSARAGREGLILHTNIGIGYETPWRQVEAMLLEAAARTPGLKQDAASFVRQKALGDFAVTYELNVYCDNAQAMGALYTELHRHILDVFNEYNVQIMTPAYEGDPEQPKVVPKEQWFTAPAKGTPPQPG